MTQLPINTIALQRIMGWLSPSFPVGAFSYSGGLETAIDTELVTNRETLADWVRAQLTYGGICTDLWYLQKSYGYSDIAALNTMAVAQRASSELRLETTSLGQSFARTICEVWKFKMPDALFRQDMSYPVIVGLAGEANEIDPTVLAIAFCHAWIANQVSVACRLIPLGQTDGQRLIAETESDAITAVAVSQSRLTDDIPPPTLSPVADWCAANHETQYSRMFRS